MGRGGRGPSGVVPRSIFSRFPTEKPDNEATRETLRSVRTRMHSISEVDNTTYPINYHPGCTSAPLVNTSPS